MLLWYDNKINELLLCKNITYDIISPNRKKLLQSIIIRDFY